MSVVPRMRNPDRSNNLKKKINKHSTREREGRREERKEGHEEITVIASPPQEKVTNHP